MGARFIVVLLLYGILAAMPWFLPALAESTNDPSIALLSLGLLLIAAATAGDLVARLHVPRITAYLMTGLFFGEQTLDLLPPDTLGVLHNLDANQPTSIVTLFAVSLIALHTGTAIRWDRFRTQWRSVLSLTAAQAVLIAIMTTVGLFALLHAAPNLLPLTASSSTATLLAVGLTMAVLSLGAGPISAVAVRDEFGSRGPWGHLVVSSHLLRELAVPFLLALLLPLAWSLPGAWQLVGRQLLLDAGISLVGGVAGGGILLLIRRVTQRNTPLLTVCFVFSVTLLCSGMSAYGSVLLFFVAGVTIQNAKQAGTSIVAVLEPLATPAYVILFLAIGASYPLDACARVLPLALVLALARTLGLMMSGSVSRWIHAEDHRTRTWLGVGGFSHFGVAFGLSFLVGLLIPVWGPIIRDAVIGSILISEVVGPFLMKTFLVRSQEAADSLAPSPSDEPAATPFERLVETGADLPPVPEAMPTDLAEPLHQLRNQLQTAMNRFSDTVGSALATGPFTYMQALQEIATERAEEGRGPILRDWARQTMTTISQSTTAETLKQGIDTLIQDLEDITHTIRPISTPETARDRRSRSNDGRLARIHKWVLRKLAALGLRSRTRRIVRLDRLVRFHLAMPLTKDLVPIQNLAVRAPVMAIENARRMLSTEQADWLNTETAMQNLQRLGDDVLARVMLLFADAMEAIYGHTFQAGTPSLPDRQTNPSRRFQANRAGRLQLDSDATRWQQLTAGLGAFVILRIEVELAEPSVHESFDKGLEGCKAMIEQHIQNPLRQVGSMATESAQSIEEAWKATDPKKVSQAIENVRDQLLTRIESMERDIDIRRDRGQLTAFWRLLWSSLSRTCHRLPDQLDVPAGDRRIPAEGMAPSDDECAQVELKVRDVAQVSVVDHSMLNLVSTEGQINELIAKTRAELSQAGQIIRFHLDSAIAELANQESQDPMGLAKEFVTGGLERAVEHSQEILDELESGRDTVIARIEEERDASIGRLHALLTVDPPAKAALYAAQYRRRSHQPPTTTTPEPEESPALKNAIARRLGALSPWRMETDSEAQLPAERFPYETASGATLDHVSELAIPKTYLRLFGFDPVGLGDFFVGREGEVAGLWQAFERWRSGRNTAVLVTGARGAGSTSLVEHFLRQLPTDYLDKTLRIRLSRRISNTRSLVREISTALGLRRVGSLARLIDHLSNWPHPIVFLLEPLGRLHIRHRGGIGALQSLRRLIGETAHRVLWVACTHDDTLQTLNALVPIEDAFTHHVSLTPMSVKDLQGLVEIRHNASGYRLLYGDENNNADSQVEYRARFYGNMEEQTHGLPICAMLHWLRSIQVEPTGRGVVCHTPQPLDLAFVQEVSTDDLLLLAQVHLHDGLTTNELARLNGWNHGEAREALRSLAWRHFVSVNAHQVHSINPIVWPAVHQRLSQGGILT